MTDSSYDPDETTDVQFDSRDVSDETTDVEYKPTNVSDETTDVAFEASIVPAAAAPGAYEFGDESVESADSQTPPFLPPQRSVWGPLWEHRIMYTDFEMVDERRLNALGDDRWELVSMASLPNERFQFVFRRSR
jgi:hypothetical protein